MVLITIVTGAYKPTYNWGTSHCRGTSIPKSSIFSHGLCMWNKQSSDWAIPKLAPFPPLSLHQATRSRRILQACMAWGKTNQQEQLQTFELVGGFNHLEKYEFVSWDDDIPNKWKVIKAMFETTNQLTYSSKMRCNHLTTEWGNTMRKKGVPIAQSHMSHIIIYYNYLRFSCDTMFFVVVVSVHG